MATKLYMFRGEMHTAEHICSVMGYSRRQLVRRTREGVPLELPRSKRVAPRSTSHWDAVPYQQDLVARKFVREHPGGAKLREVGEAMGVCRERIRQIEERALLKLAQVEGGDDIVAMLRALDESRRPGVWDRIEAENEWEDRTRDWSFERWHEGAGSMKAIAARSGRVFVDDHRRGRE